MQAILEEEEGQEDDSDGSLSEDDECSGVEGASVQESDAVEAMS